MTSVDPADYAREQSAAWSSVAAAWDAWWPVLEGAAQHLNERLVELAGVEPGHRVLDLACGIGEPALTAARRAGAGGSVVAIDLAPEMLSFARRRAAEAGLDVRFTLGNAEEIELERSAFDAAVCRWGLMLMLRPSLALENARRALRPGGRLAAAVWGPEERGPFLSLPRAVAARELGLPAPDPDAPGPFRLGDAAELRGLVESAGFGDVRAETQVVAPSFGSGEHYVRFLADMSSSLADALADRPRGDVERFWRAVAERAEAFRRPDGRIVLESEVLCVVGTA